MKQLLTITFLCLKLVSFGQEEINEKKKVNSIVFAPFNLLDPVNPSYQLGYQRQLNEKWELQLEGAILMKIGLFDMVFEGLTSRDLHKGFRLRSELKHYLSQRNWFKHYLSSELFYLRNNTRKNLTFVSNEVGRYQDEFLNKKKKYGINIKYGIKILIKKIFLFEPHIGIGISYREIRHENREDIDDPLDAVDWTDDNKIIGNRWVLNFPLNIKVGYVF